jgi:hypothetical protein
MDTASGSFLSRSGFAQQQRRPTAFSQLIGQSQNLPYKNGFTHQHVTAFFKWRKHARSRLLKVECVSQS